MKNTFHTIILFLICFSANAQSAWKNIGFDIGYSQAAQVKQAFSMSGITPWDQNIQSAYFGFDYADTITAHWAWDAGVRFTQRGYKIQYTNTLDSLVVFTSYQYLLNYIDVPLNISYSFAKRLHIKAGLVPSFLLTDNFRFAQVQETHSSNLNYKYAFQGSGRFKTFDIGINIGIGVRLNRYLDFEVNAVRGLIKPDKQNGNEILYSQMFLIGIRYRFLNNK